MYTILVNRNNILDEDYIPDNLILVDSKYKKDIYLDKEVYKNFLLLKKEALSNNYHIDIVSGYRSYDYQKKIFDKLVKDKGMNYAISKIAPAGASEHQTGYAIDYLVFRNNKCYTENDLKDLPETKWVINNCYKYGFIIRYPEGKEDVTCYSYEPWHLRYVGSISKYLYENNITLDEYCVNYK